MSGIHLLILLFFSRVKGSWALVGNTILAENPSVMEITSGNQVPSARVHRACEYAVSCHSASWRRFILLNTVIRMVTTVGRLQKNHIRTDCLEEASAAANLLDEYSSRHRHCLQNPGSHAQYIVYKGTTFAGMGNVLPPVVTGFLLALMTDRVFFIDFPMFGAIFAHELDFNWTKNSATLLGTRRNVTTIQTFSGFEDKALGLWLHGDLEDVFSRQDVVYYGPDMDSLSPVLIANQHYASFFKKYFPTREVFSRLSQFLFTLTPALQLVVDSFHRRHFGNFTVGLQIRKRKCGIDAVPCEHLPRIESFCSVAKALQYSAGISDEDVRFFVATDTEATLAQVKNILGAERVVHTNYNMTTFTEAGNPGTHEAAVVDLKLLSLCDDLVITSASSFGSVAAGWGNIKGVHMTFGNPHRLRFLENPHFWRALTSEPCFWGFSKFKNSANEDDVRTILASPFGLQHEQCHF